MKIDLKIIIQSILTACLIASIVATARAEIDTKVFKIELDGQKDQIKRIDKNTQRNSNKLDRIIEKLTLIKCN